MTVALPFGVFYKRRSLQVFKEHFDFSLSVRKHYSFLLKNGEQNKFDLLIRPLSLSV